MCCNLRDDAPWFIVGLHSVAAQVAEMMFLSRELLGGVQTFKRLSRGSLSGASTCSSWVSASPVFLHIAWPAQCVLHRKMPHHSSFFLLGDLFRGHHTASIWPSWWLVPVASLQHHI